MKKIGLLVMPLTAVSFLASCNKGGGGGSPNLTKEEFDYANSLKDIEQVQIEPVSNHEATVEAPGIRQHTLMINERRNELAPSINHLTVTATDDQDGKITTKRHQKCSRLISGDKKQCEYVEKEEEKDWGKSQIGSIEDNYYYPTQYNLVGALEQMLVTDLKPALTYENTKYKNGKFVYEGEGKIDSYNDVDEGIPVTIAIIYSKDKKLKNVDVDFEEVTFEQDDTKATLKFTASVAYTYEDITPTWPIPENSK